MLILLTGLIAEEDEDEEDDAVDVLAVELFVPKDDGTAGDEDVVVGFLAYIMDDLGMMLGFVGETLCRFTSGEMDIGFSEEPLPFPVIDNS